MSFLFMLLALPALASEPVVCESKTVHVKFSMDSLEASLDGANLHCRESQATSAFLCGEAPRLVVNLDRDRNPVSARPWGEAHAVPCAPAVKISKSN